MGEKLDKTQPVPRCKPENGDEVVEIASEDSFPASDPPSYSPITHTGKPVHKRRTKDKS